jgi:L-ascorbate metabolism protein UlaG (beta-lactamase superfamily)
LQLTWLGAAGFKVDTSEGATLLINPYLSRPAQATPFLPLHLVDLTPVDEIFLSDGRFDHALDTPALVRQTGAIVHAVEPLCQQLMAQGVSAHNLQSIMPQMRKSVGSFSWQALANLSPPANSSLNEDPFKGDLPITPHLDEPRQSWSAEEAVAYSFRIDGLTMVHFSSVAWSEADVGELQPDLALLPVESNPDTSAASARLAAWLQPKVVILHHWDNYWPPLSQLSDLTPFETALPALAPRTRIYKPIIGQSFDPIHLLF